eukprot:s4024_g4.t2
MAVVEWWRRSGSFGNSGSSGRGAQAHSTSLGAKGHTVEPLFTFEGCAFDGDRIVNIRENPHCFTHQLGGAISIAFTARWDAFQLRSRILDFGDGPGVDNIVIGNLEKGRTLLVEVYRGPSKKRMLMPGSLMLGETNSYLLSISETGHMRMLRDGDQLGVQPQGFAPRSVERRKLLVGGSNSTGDENFEGDIRDLRIWRGEADENCEVGQVLAVLGPPGEGVPAAAEAAAPAAAAPAAAPAAKAGPKVDVATPELGGESITEGAIAEWTVKVGQNVKKDQVIATIETDKVTVDVKAPQDGQLLEIKCQAEETVEVGQILAVLGPPGDGAPVATEAAAPAAAAAPKAAPKAAPAPKSAAAPAAASAPSSPERGERREKMTRMRQAIARNLKESQNTLAMLTTFQEVDMSGLIKMRKEYKDIFQSSHGAKLGFQSPFFLASAYALKQIPALNAYIDNATNEVVFRDYINIGFAAATPKGLVTPVIKNMETKNLAEVESEFARFAGLAKQDKLSMDDITGNTFTITNGGATLEEGVVLVMKNGFLDDLLEDSSPESAQVAVNSDSVNFCTPCPFFWKPSGCVEGRSCNFCHLCPDPTIQPAKLGKKKAVQSTPPAAAIGGAWGEPQMARLPIPMAEADAGVVDATTVIFVFVASGVDLVDGYAQYVGAGQSIGASTTSEQHQKVLEMQQKLCPSIFEDHAAGHARMDGWMDGWREGWMDGCVFGSMLGTPLIGSINSAAALGLHATKDRAVVLPNGEIGVRPIMYLALTYDHRLVDGREAVTFLCMIRDQVEAFFSFALRPKEDAAGNLSVSLSRGYFS